MRIEEDGAAMSELGDRNHVPDIEGRDESGEKIDVDSGVTASLAGGAATNDDLIAVTSAAMRRQECGLDLDAKHAAVVLNEKVIGVTVSVRFGDGDAFAGGAIHEGDFSKFAAEFGIGCGVD